MVALLAISLPFILTLTGLCLLVSGLRGRRIDRHPHCRRCRFDLNLLWPDHTTCPECGYEHGQRRPHIGLRRRRPKMIIWAIPLLLMGAALFVAFSGGELGVNLNKHKPLGWLLWEIRHASSRNAVGAIREVGQRHLAATLTPAEVSQFVDSMLVLQGDTRRDWQPTFGDLIVGLYSQGSISEAQWDTYQSQIVHASLEYRPRVRSTGWVAADLIIHDVRGGTQEQNWTPSPSMAVFAGHSSRVRTASIRTVDGITQMSLRNIRVPDLAPGDAVIDLHLASPYDRRINFNFPMNVQIVGSETELVEVVTDPARAPIVNMAGTSVELRGPPKRSVLVSIDFTPRPCDLVMRVVHDLDEGRWLDRLLVLDQDAVQSSFHVRRLLSETMARSLADETAIDITLTPDLALAEQTLGITQVWGEPIIIRRLPVEEIE